MSAPPPDHFVTTNQFTKRVHRDVYPAVDPANPELSLAGKVVIITGASRGIGGRGLVPAFAKAGPKALVLVARNVEKLNAKAEEVKKINSSVETLVVGVDLTDEPSIKGLFEKVKAAYGHADILVNNGAVSEATAMAKDIDPVLWWDDLSTNIRATWFPTSHFLKSLPADAPATIINVTTAAHLVIPSMSSYMCAKLPMTHLAAFVAAENPNVTSIAVYPGLVKTDMTLDMFQPFAHDTPELAGGTVVWLCSEKAKFLNGKFTNVNWDVEDLYERREEVVEKKLLQLDLTGKFGHEQFE